MGGERSMATERRCMVRISVLVPQNGVVGLATDGIVGIVASRWLTKVVGRGGRLKPRAADDPRPIVPAGG